MFDVLPEFATEYRQAMLIAMHKSKKADAYVIYLLDDLEQGKQTIQETLSSLRFSASQGDGKR